jgi:putative effector of murein hydrolase
MIAGPLRILGFQGVDERIGTARAFNVHPEAGAYSSLAMGLHGVLGAVLIPLAAGRF